MTTSSAPQAVITGIGHLGPHGVGGCDLIAAVLRDNISAIEPLTGFAADGGARRLGACMPESALTPTDESRRWSRVSQMAVAACRHAVAEAGVSEPDMLRHFGLVVGSEYGDLQSTEAFGSGFLRRGPRGLRAFLFPNTVMNAIAGTVSIALGVQGPMLTLNQPGVAGELAVARAVALLAAGRAPAVIACGVDELFPLLYNVLGLLHVTSPRDGGEEACAPFDQRHNGPILGEGATAVVLETPEHARARSAPILAGVRSALWGGQAARPYRYPAPSQLHHRLLHRALSAAGASPQDIDAAYLSGSGDPEHDAAELALMAGVFGPDRPCMTSVTHLAGEYGGLGALRVAAASLTASLGVSPMLDYLCHPIRRDLCFATQPRPAAPAMVLAHGLGRGGMQVALVVGPPS
jgi:3-oxoacyl-[acyl-carrier-protein] synthase II